MLGIYSTDCAHTQFNLLYWCAYHMFPIQILFLTVLRGTVNAMTVLLNHLADLAVAQICLVEGVFYPLLLERAWGNMWLLLWV